MSEKVSILIQEYDLWYESNGVTGKSESESDKGSKMLWKAN